MLLAAVEDEILAMPPKIQARIIKLLELHGANLGPPHTDSMGFDPLRQAIVLCAGNKGGNKKRFYKQMIPIANFELTKYLEELEK
ncbi:hypothetical protein C9I86_13145 [Photobacterium sp. NCIMB 13483]|nr:hypothetical protein C9I86_13145 [Photobacterium sp. NCIMB 13483]